MTRRTSVDVAREVGGSPDLAQFAADVSYYLVQDPRQLPSRYLYDALGSVLFEAICHLPWYAITRAESRLLATHAQEIVARLERLGAIVELGPGTGEKLRMLLAGSGLDHPRLDVHLVDVSPKALQASRETLSSIDGVRVIEHATSYETGLAQASRQTAGGRSLVLFLGSNIGNFDPPGAAALLHSIRAELSSGDALLLGADLVKPERQLLLAYDDPLGVTAAFNRNLLVRINRELRGNFAIAKFAHEAVWNADASRIEMHLVARSAQHVEIPGSALEIAFRAGERIWTESSYKYQPGEIVSMLAGAGFRVAEQWIDRDAAFALTLAEAE